MTTPGVVVVNFEHLMAVWPGGSPTIKAGLTEALFESGMEAVDEVPITALIARAVAELQAAQTLPGVLSAPDDQVASLIQSFVAEHAPESRLIPTDDDLALEVKMDTHDARWWPLAGAYIRSKLGLANRHPRPILPTSATGIPNDARLALLGDWGTGLYGAPVAARSVAADGRFQAVIHLGDVYYSGTEDEVEKRFLSKWPKVTGALNRACNSNHEMYSGGGPYFTRTLPAFRQSSSTYLLENDHWVLVGLDTAYLDADLDADQMIWLANLTAVDDGRKLIFLSHHQPISRLSGQNPRIGEKLAPLLEAGRVKAWYWGHEHRLAIYDIHPGWGLHGRCVGHGGIPYLRPRLPGADTEVLPADQRFLVLPGTGAVPTARVLDGPNPYVKRHEERYGPNGYMTIQLDGPHLMETLYAPDGTTLWENVLVST